MFCPGHGGNRMITAWSSSSNENIIYYYHPINNKVRTLGKYNSWYHYGTHKHLLAHKEVSKHPAWTKMILWEGEYFLPVYERFMNATSMLWALSGHLKFKQSAEKKSDNPRVNSKQAHNTHKMIDLSITSDQYRTSWSNHSMLWQLVVINLRRTPTGQKVLN